MNAYHIFDLDINKIDTYTKEDIKRIYKKIALECHPDKIKDIDDIEKAKKIEKFKHASIAYKKILEDFDKYGKLSYVSDIHSEFDFDFNDFCAEDFEIYKDFDIGFWKDAIDMFMNMNNKGEILKDTIKSVSGFFLKNKIYPKKYYTPSQEDVIKHNITLPITYAEVYNDNRKKLRLILKGIDEPVFLYVYCKKEYPVVKKQYIDDDGKEHEINIIYKLVSNKENYAHIMKEGCEIDLITSIDIKMVDYLTGCRQEIMFVNDQFIYLDIEAFSDLRIVKRGFGLLGGDLIVNINILHIQENHWMKLDEKDKNTMISILKMI